jgi:hypothetical protein
MTNEDSYPNHKVQQIAYKPGLLIALPNYTQFIHQQFFGLKRLLFDPDGTMAKDPTRRAKGIILWRRMVYMKELLKATYRNLPFDVNPLLQAIDRGAESLGSGTELDTYCRDAKHPISNYALSMLCSAQRAQPPRKQRKTRKNRKA